MGKKGKPGLLDAAALEDPVGVHLCPLICNKPLSCGIHFCERNDHRKFIRVELCSVLIGRQAVLVEDV